MIYDAVENVTADLVANFAADFAAVVAAKGIGGLGLDGSIVVYDRQPSTIFAAIAGVPGGAARLPGVGVYFVHGTTQAKVTARRPGSLWIMRDYFARGTDPAKIVKQAEIAVEALLKHIDRCFALAPIVGTGEAENSVTIDMLDVKQAGEDSYEQQVLISAPSTTWDQGL